METAVLAAVGLVVVVFVAVLAAHLGKVFARHGAGAGGISEQIGPDGTFTLSLTSAPRPSEVWFRFDLEHPSTDDEYNIAVGITLESGGQPHSAAEWHTGPRAPQLSVATPSRVPSFRAVTGTAGSFLLLTAPATQGEWVARGVVRCGGDTRLASGKVYVAA